MLSILIQQSIYCAPCRLNLMPGNRHPQSQAGEEIIGPAMRAEVLRLGLIGCSSPSPKRKKNSGVPTKGVTN